MGRKSKNKKEKLEVIFDPKSRRDFLTGFRKRKNERKKRAKEELERLLKEEKKNIKKEIREGVYKHLKKSFEPIPEIDEILKEKDTIVEDDETIVKVTELSINQIAQQENWLGENNFKIKSDNNSDNDDHVDDVIEEQVFNKNDIPGMSTNRNNNEYLKIKSKLQDGEKLNKLETLKDQNQLKQKHILKCLKKSKLQKLKRNMDRIANRKVAKKEKNRQLRQLRKDGKKNPKKYLALQKSKQKLQDKQRQRNK